MRRNGENGMQMKTFDLEEQINGNANDVIDLVDRFNANVVYRIEEIVSLHSAFFALCLLGPNYNSSYFFKVQVPDWILLLLPFLYGALLFSRIVFDSLIVYRVEQQLNL